MVGTCFSDYEKLLPQEVDTSSLVYRCWKHLKATLKRHDVKSGSSSLQYLSLFFCLAEARGLSIAQASGSGENNIVAHLEKLLVKLEDLYIPLIFLLYERIKFFHRVRSQHEKPQDYVSALESLAEVCEFKEHKHGKIKEQFINQGQLNSSLICIAQTCDASNLKQLIELWGIQQDEKSIKKVKRSGKAQKNSTVVKESVKEALKKKTTKDNKLYETQICQWKSSGTAVLSLKQQRKKRHGKAKALLKQASSPSLTSSPQSHQVKDNVFNNDIQTTISDKSERKQLNKRKLSYETKESFQTGLYESNLDVSGLEIDVTVSNCRGKSIEEEKTDDECEIGQCDEGNKYDDPDHYSHTLEYKKPETLITFVFQDEIFKDTQKAKQPSSCKVCQEVFHSVESLQEHSKSHDSSCAFCGKIFDFPSRLSQHMFIHTGIRYIPKKRTGGPKPSERRHEEYNCTVCSQKFKGKRVYNNHMKIHNLYCKFCDKVIACKSNFKLHMDTHSGNRPYPCTNCHRSFTRKSDLKAHLQVHDPKREKSHICDYCGKDFFRIHELQRHQSLHTGNKPHKCDVCGRGFPTAHGLKSHCMLHTGIKSYVCDKCGKSFASKSNLVTHLIRHTGVKNYSCPTCDAKFARKCYLRSHLRSHTKERPYSCNICGACVSSKFSLQRHHLIHTGHKPYQCSLCNKTFMWHSTYQKHLENHKNTTQNVVSQEAAQHENTQSAEAEKCGSNTQAKELTTIETSRVVKNEENISHKKTVGVATIDIKNQTQNNTIIDHMYHYHQKDAQATREDYSYHHRNAGVVEIIHPHTQQSRIIESDYLFQQDQVVSTDTPQVHPHTHSSSIEPQVTIYQQQQHNFTYEQRVQEQALDLQCGQRVDRPGPFVGQLAPVSFSSSLETTPQEHSNLQFQSHQAYDHDIHSGEEQVITSSNTQMEEEGFH